MNYIRLANHPKLDLVGRMLDWKSYYGSVGTPHVKELVSTPVFVVTNPKSVRRVGKPQNFPYHGTTPLQRDDYLHTIIENWMIRIERGDRVANAFRRTEVNLGKEPEATAQFYFVPEDCLRRIEEQVSETSSKLSESAILIPDDTKRRKVQKTRRAKETFSNFSNFTTICNRTGVWERKI